VSTPADDRPPGARGVIALVEDNCTVCMLCVRECPDWCIEIDSHTETLPADDEHRRPRSVAVLDRFAIDFGLCLYCGICIEVCPFDALHWSPVATYAAGAPADLVHDTGRLASWEATVPVRTEPPPAADTGP
jgi:NADH-quinone oxidoreductase subunit I